MDEAREPGRPSKFCRCATPVLNVGVCMECRGQARPAARLLSPEQLRAKYAAEAKVQHPSTAVLARLHSLQERGKDAEP
jgi:hypothetical protein